MKNLTSFPKLISYLLLILSAGCSKSTNENQAKASAPYSLSSESAPQFNRLITPDSTATAQELPNLTLSTETKSCDVHLQEIGSNYFTGTLGMILAATETGFYLGFESRTYERTQPMFSERFNPVEAGYSIKFRDTKGDVIVPISAYQSAPGKTEDSGIVSVGFGNQIRSRVTFHIVRNPALENLNAATAELYCHGKLVGSGFSYIQAFTNPAKDPDACKHRGGEAINGSCHFGYSCLTLTKAASEIHADATSGYSSCFKAAPVLHPDCVKGYGSERGYVASCPLLNAQEAPSVSAVSSTMATIFHLYRELRKRNPDAEGYNYWRSEIDRDPARLRVLESMLRQ